MKIKERIAVKFLPLSVVAACVGVLTFSPIAHASEPVLIGTHGDWSAYSFEENGNKVCYMVAKPQKSEGNYTTRGDVHALVTHRPAENARDVFSFTAGYPYKDASDVSVDISGKKFSLFTQDETAWAADADADARIAAALRSGSNMVVKGTSRRGTATTDTFGLTGSGAAYDAISAACGQ